MKKAAQQPEDDTVEQVWIVLDILRKATYKRYNSESRCCIEETIFSDEEIVKIKNHLKELIGLDEEN